MAAGWDALPDNQQDSATAEALRAIVELDLWRSNHPVVSAVIEQRDGLTGIGHDDAWKGGRHQLVAV
jgi:hypothetical protein